ncbi:MAG: ATP-binding cassette domain-containing protein [Myxococcota bacterium]
MKRGGVQLDRLTIRRGVFTILREATLDVPSGGSLVLTGVNGIGKSTLLQVMAGLLAPAGGTIRLGNEAPEPGRPDRLIRHGVRRGCVFQQGGLVANLTAFANVELPLRYHADALGLSSSVIAERARFCLEAVGVEESDMYALPGLLSFGIRKRVAFARAVAIEPNYAFFDDPDAGLDHENAEVVHEILMSYRDDPTVTMVVVTNHRGLIRRLACPTYELDRAALRPVDLDSTRALVP